MPQVSVGIPIFNGEHHLAGLLESLVNQEFSDVEFIVCDNGSTDRSDEIYKEFALCDSRFRIFRYDTNTGPERNYIRAFEFATGEYMLWAAHDDRFHPAYIRRCVETLQEHPDAALAYSWTRFIDNDGNTLTECQDPFDLTSDSPVERYLNLIGKLGYCNALYGVHRASVLNKTKLFRNLCLGRDALLLTEILFYGKWIQIPETLFYRNMHTKFCSVEGRNKDPRKWIEQEEYPPGTGITFPNFEYLLRYFQLIKTAPIEPESRPVLIKATIDALAKVPYFEKVRPEIERAISLVCHHRFYQEWNEDRFQPPQTAEWDQYARPLYLTQLLQNFEEILLIYPNFTGVQTARAVCLAYLQRKREALAALESEMERNPQFAPAKALYQNLKG